MNRLEEIFYSTYESPLGILTIASEDNKLIGLWIEGQKYFPKINNKYLNKYNNLEVFYNTKCWLDKYFSCKNPQITELPLSPKGSHFRQTVWKLLLKIPYGEVRTYKHIAKDVAKLTNKQQMSAQAIGGAVSHNPISIIIPCHRVISTNGSLTGYAGGIEKKLWLLNHEGVQCLH